MQPRTFRGAGISNPAGIKKSTGAANLQYFTLKQIEQHPRELGAVTTRLFKV